MKSFFKREQAEEREDAPLPSLREARAFTPVSAKSPDAQRLNLFNPDEEIDEETDQDLAFLNSLIADEAPPRRRPATKAPPEPREQVREQIVDDMDVFREMAALRQRTEIAKQLRVDNVDMGELLDDLETTRAALRRWLRAA
jgi:hypothetical protein